MESRRIVIQNSNTDPEEGFLDSNTIYQYIEGGDIPTFYANALAKARAFHRHRSMILAIQFYSGMRVVNVVTSDAVVDDAPTQIAYTIEIDDLDSVTTPDELNNGATLTGIAAIERIAARVLTRTWTRALEVYDPTTTTARGNTTPFARTGPRVVNDTIGPVYSTLAAAEAAISVTNVGP